MTKQVVYVESFAQPAFTGALSRHADVRLTGVSARSSDPEAEAALANAHAYHVSSSVNEVDPGYLVNAGLLARTPNLLVVSTMGAGYDTVDVPACTSAGVIVVNQGGGGNAEAVAEHVLGMMLGLIKHMPDAGRRMRRAPGIKRIDYIGRNALGRTIGIIGLGQVGRRLCELCRAALSMRVLVYDPGRSREELLRLGAEGIGLDELLGRSDFVSVCCSLTDTTRGMIGRKEFALMKKDAYFITTARGGIHDEAALVDALREHRIAGAGVDVWDVEPPPPDHPLLGFDNVIATPHIAGSTIESRTQAAEGAAQQILDVLSGKRPSRLLNPEAWERFRARFERQFGFMPI